MRNDHSTQGEKLAAQCKALWARLKASRYGLPAVCIAVVLLAALVVVLAVSCAKQPVPSSSASSDAASSEAAAGSQSYEQVAEDQDYQSTEIDTQAFSGTVLPETEDAGEDYVKNTLFIGDSNTVRYMSYGFATLENAIGVIGMGASDARTLESVKFKTYSSLVTIPKAVSIMQPQRIIIGFGTNNLTGDLNTYLKEYAKTIQKIYDAYPYCDIIVNAIPPVDKNRDYPKVTMQNIDKFNEALVEMCEENGWKFLNSTEALKDSKTGFCKTEYTVQDGLHLSKEGVTALFNYIRTHAYETEDRRPKPLSSVPQRGETPPDLIVKDPLKTEGGSTKVTKVQVSFTAAEGGSISGTVEQSVEPGKAAETVTAVPNEGYEFAGWSCTTGRIDDTSDPVLTFTVPGDAANFGGVFVTASFKPVGYSVRFSLSSLAGGRLVVGDTTVESAAVAVNRGKTASVTLKLNEGYTVVQQDGYKVSKNDNGSYTVSVEQVTKDLEITIKLQQLATPTPTPTPTPVVTPTPTPDAATPTPTPEQSEATPTPTPEQPAGSAATPEPATPEPTPVPTPEPTPEPVSEPTPEPVVETPAPSANDAPADPPAAEAPSAADPAADSGAAASLEAETAPDAAAADTASAG